MEKTFVLLFIFALVWSGECRRFANVATGRCLDTNGLEVFTYPCNGGSRQQWTWRPDGSIQNVLTHICLNGVMEPPTFGKFINGLNCKSSLFQQQWVGEAGQKRVRSIATGLCLDSDPRGQVYAIGCNGGTNQNWDY